MACGKPTPQERLEDVRRLAARHGIPFDVVDKLALRQRKVAELIDVSLRTVESLCARGELEVSDIGGAPRVLVISLLEYLERHRRAPGSRGRGRRGAEQTPPTRARALIDAAIARRRERSR